MPDILHDFLINAPIARVFEAVSRPADLEQWWTKRSSGEPQEGAEYELWFGPDDDWRATVTRYVPNKAFELQLTSAVEDWQGTRVGFGLEPAEGKTQVRFHHTGWPEPNAHYRISCYCWAMYLRILKRYLEYSETVAYEDRLDA